MGLSSLNAALAGLRASQSQIDVISTNVANVGTPGYSRKILPQTAQTVNGKTVGVLPETVIRNVSISLSRDLWTQVSASSKLNVKASYLERIDGFHGPPDQEISIAAEVSQLFDLFAVLSDDPVNPFAQSQTVSQAMETADKFNDLSSLITRLRNDIQDEISTTVTSINDLLDQIKELNDQIAVSLNVGRSTAQAEDLRDEAVKNLSELIEISFFKRGDGVMVVQTNEGIELAGSITSPLTFQSNRVSATSHYPDSINGIYVGDPSVSPTAIDITLRSPNGKLGALIDLRDTTFPKQMAQLDELAHKMASRFDAQGLRLFTDETGSVPLDTAPNTTTTPEVAVPYVGFAGKMRVNENIINDNTLLQTGTGSFTVVTGSNEVIRRVIEFTFGDVDFQRAIGDVDLNVSGNGAASDTLQEFLGLASENTVQGSRNLSGFADPASFISAANGILGVTSDTFRLTFEEAGLGLGPVDVDIALSGIADGAGNFVQDLITHITGTVIPALGAGDQTALTSMGVTFTEGTNGQLVINSIGDITVDGTNPANPMGSGGLALLGFAEETVQSTDPYFDIAVGQNALTRITIAPGDDETDLLTQLQAVTGLAVEDFSASVDGFLRVRPGEDYANPQYGGDLRIISGPFAVSGSAGGLPDGINVVSALFGSYSASNQNVSPLSDVNYASTISTTNAATVPFREDFLGPGANISTRVDGSLSLIDYAQKMINEQTQELILTQSRITDEDTLRDLLETKLLNDSGVNIDEELGSLIVAQTAYSAAARVIAAVDESFQELLNAL